MASVKKLNEKQLAFISFFLIDFDATNAAIKAGYSKKTANSYGSQLLSNPKIKKELAKRQKAFGNKNEKLKQKVLDRLKTIAFSNLKNYGEFNEHGLRIRNSEDIDDETASAISEFSVSENSSGVNLKFKLKSSEKALEMLARHTGILSDTVPVEVKPFIIKTSKGDIELGIKQEDDRDESES